MLLYWIAVPQSLPNLRLQLVASAVTHRPQSLPDVPTCGSWFQDSIPISGKKNLELGEEPNFIQAPRPKEIQLKMYKAVNVKRFTPHSISQPLNQYWSPRGCCQNPVLSAGACRVWDFTVHVMASCFRLGQVVLNSGRQLLGLGFRSRLKTKQLLIRTVFGMPHWK